MKILVLNGPNLSRLDLRESEFYGSKSYEDVVDELKIFASELGISIEVRQSDDEATLVSWLHEAADKKIPVIINPAAFTHYSYSIRDAVSMLTAPCIEVHLSNPLAREEFRHTSVISGVVKGTVSGFGVDSYKLAMRAMMNLTN